MSCILYTQVKVTQQTWMVEGIPQTYKTQGDKFCLLKAY